MAFSTTNSLAMTTLDKSLATISAEDRESCLKLFNEAPLAIGQGLRDIQIAPGFKNYGLDMARKYTDSDKEYHTSGRSKDYSKIMLLKPGCKTIQDNASEITEVACGLENGLDIEYSLMLHEQRSSYILLYSDAQRQVLHIRRFWKDCAEQEGANAGVPNTRMGVGLTFKFSEIVRVIQLITLFYQFLEDYVPLQQ